MRYALTRCSGVLLAFVIGVACTTSTPATRDTPDSGSHDAQPTTDGDAGVVSTGPGQWRALRPPSHGRQEHAVVALAGEIYVIGGFDAEPAVLDTMEVYNPSTDQWRRVADLPVPMHHVNAAVIEDKLYIVGFLSGASFVEDGRGWSYAAATDVWTPLTPMQNPRGSAAVGAIGRKIYVAGGMRDLQAVRDASVFDVDQNRWQPLPALPVPADHAAAGVIDGAFYVAGGRESELEAHTPLLFRFDPQQQRWARPRPMPTSRAGAASAVLAGKLYVFGGEGNSDLASGVFDDVEAYDPLTDSWQVLRAMSTPRHGMGAAALGDRIYVPAGGTTQGFGVVDVHEVFIR